MRKFLPISVSFQRYISKVLVIDEKEIGNMYEQDEVILFN
jgi:hypothetical protein